MGVVHNLFCMQLIYRKATDLCALILSPVTLLNLFIISRVFWQNFWVFSCIVWYHLQLGIVFTYFPVCIISNFFSCCITSTSILSKILKGNKNTGNHCLISDFSWVASNFSLFRMMLSVGFISFYLFFLLLGFQTEFL